MINFYIYLADDSHKSMDVFNKNNRIKANQLNSNYVYLRIFPSFRHIINPDVVKNIQAMKENIWSHFNAGTYKTKIKDDLGTLKVCFKKSGITNIMSFGKVELVYLITYDHTNQLFVVHTKGLGYKDGKLTFKRGNEVFFKCYLLDHKGSIMLVNTSGEKTEGFTKTKVERSSNAKKSVVRLYNPTE